MEERILEIIGLNFNEFDRMTDEGPAAFGIAQLITKFIMWMKSELNCVNIRTSDEWLVDSKLMKLEEVFKYWYDNFYK